MDLALIIVLFVGGIAAMFLEMFLPGAIIGTMGFVAVVASIVLAFTNGYTLLGGVLIGVTLAFLPLFFVIWKNVLSRFFATTGDERDFRPSSTIIREELEGEEGMALSPLRPSGIARLKGRRYDVVTRGEMLEKGTRIKVIEVSGNRIVVTRAS